MSFNRLMYDKCNQKFKFKDTTSPGLYQLNTPILCNNCFQQNPQIINQRNGVSMKRNTDWRFYSGPIDVESDLYNIQRPSTKCPDGKFEPKCSKCLAGSGINVLCNKCKKDDLVKFEDCNFPTENTRLSNPPSTLRSTGWNRFEYLCLNPQANLLFSNQLGIDTKQLAKDNHKMCVQKVNINSMDMHT